VNDVYTCPMGDVDPGFNEQMLDMWLSLIGGIHSPMPMRFATVVPINPGDLGATTTTTATTATPSTTAPVTPTPTATNGQVAKEVKPLMAQFVQGVWPDRTVHGPGSAITRQMMTAPAVNSLRSKFEASNRKNEITEDSKWGIFGGDDYVFGTGSLARQFVGSFSVTVRPMGDYALYMISDTRSAWSLLLHSVPSWPRGDLYNVPRTVPYNTFAQPLSTTLQTYWWIEGRP
jgi:hypothetical protein